MAEPALDALPGYRRRFRVTPGPGSVTSELEDDFHRMAVTLRHEDGVVTAVSAEQDRAPWTTCPGAVIQVAETFTGARLEAFAAPAEKAANCTHLYDLAVLAAAHAGDAEPLVYDILVGDPVATRRRMELRRDGAPVISWVEEAGRLTEPSEIAGLTLMDMGRWLVGLDPVRQEEARLLRWGALVAQGRTIPMTEQSDASSMPPSCYTFQPERAVLARRVGEIRDFSAGTAEPLDHRPAIAGAISRERP